MDYALFDAVNDLAGTPGLDPVMEAAATYLIFAVFAVCGVLCAVRLRQRQIRPVLATGLALLATFLLGLLAGALYPEDRPFQSHHVDQLVSHAAGQSFPSDHATAAFGVALATWVFLDRRWGVALFAAAVLIGFARVYVGVHYPVDILGGLLAAVVGVGIVAWAERRMPEVPAATG